MSQERSVGNSAESPTERAPSIRGYRMKAADIPLEIKQNVAGYLGHNVDVVPAKDNGTYKGPVVYADPRYIVQAVGKERATTVIHQRADLEIMGASLQARNANNDLQNRNLQVHYRGDAAKVYPWNAEQEAQQRAARSTQTQQKQTEQIAGAVISEAQKYAAEHIKNGKQREAFLKHLGNVTQQLQKPAQQETRNATRTDLNKSAQRASQQQATNDIER